MQIYLYASDLAACIGKNQYQSVDDAKIKVWMRRDPEAFVRAQQRVNVRHHTREEIVRDLPIGIGESISRAVNDPSEAGASLAVEKMMTSPANDAGHACAIRDAIVHDTGIETVCDKLSGKSHLLPRMKKLGTDCTVEDVRKVLESVAVGDVAEARDAVVHAVNTKRGRRNEASATDAYEASKRARVSGRNDRFLRTKIGETSSGTDVLVGGRVDGVTDDRVVEIKCRRNRFFSCLVPYERVQIHAYMVLTGKDKADLVQRYNGNVKATTYAFNETFWGEVLEGAVEFAEELEELEASESLQDELLLQCRG